MKQSPVIYGTAAVALLSVGGVGVIPTDTLYGIVGSAFDPKAVRRIYRLRKRNLKKPMVILVGSVGDLLHFGVRISPRVKKILNKIWPGKVSVVLPIGRHARLLAKFNYLHKGMGTLAFRLPKSKSLRTLLEKTGPLVAPSANFEGEAPAATVREAKKYFGKKVGFYIDGGRLGGKPSTLIKIEGGKIRVLRKGAIAIRDTMI